MIRFLGVHRRSGRRKHHPGPLPHEVVVPSGADATAIRIPTCSSRSTEDISQILGDLHPWRPRRPGGHARYQAVDQLPAGGSRTENVHEKFLPQSFSVCAMNTNPCGDSITSGRTAAGGSFEECVIALVRPRHSLAGSSSQLSLWQPNLHLRTGRSYVGRARSAVPASRAHPPVARRSRRFAITCA